MAQDNDLNRTGPIEKDSALAQEISVTNLESVKKQTIGGPPLYEQLFRTKLEDNRQGYNPEEENVICGRFPHLDVCACDVACGQGIPDITLFEVYNGIFMGPFQSAFKTGELIQNGVTHILNVTCKAYTKREQYFKYLDL